MEALNIGVDKLCEESLRGFPVAERQIQVSHQRQDLGVARSNLATLEPLREVLDEGRVSSNARQMKIAVDVQRVLLEDGLVQLDHGKNTFCSLVKAVQIERDVNRQPALEVAILVLDKERCVL